MFTLVFHIWKMSLTVLRVLKTIIPKSYSKDIAYKDYKIGLIY